MTELPRQPEQPVDTGAEATPAEQRAVFLLALLMLTSIVSLSFFHLDQHAPFPPLPQKMTTTVRAIDAPALFAYDSITLASLETQRTHFEPQIYPLSTWPPEGPVVALDASHRRMYGAGLELKLEQGPWSFWLPRDFVPLPFFGMARVEIEDREGRIRQCPRDNEGAFQCGAAGWTRMRQRTMTVERQSEECIWAHPLENRTLRFRFPDVQTRGPQGESLVLQTALRDAAVGTGAPVDVRIRHGDETTLHRHHDRRGWQETTIDAHAGPNDLLVEIEADRPGRRHFCFRFAFQ